MDGLLAGWAPVHGERNWCPVNLINERDRRDRRERSSTLPLGFVGSFSKSAPYVREVGNAFVEPVPEHRAVLFFACYVPARSRLARFPNSALGGRPNR